jgi:hypothetical protein
MVDTHFGEYRLQERSEAFDSFTGLPEMREGVPEARVLHKVEPGGETAKLGMEV